MSMPILNVPTPETKPAVTFDRFWLETLVVRSSVGGDATAHVTLTPYSSTTGESSPNAVTMEVPNIMAGAEESPAMALALAAVLEAVKAEGIARGVIAAETP
jgi:uncharacterized protein YcnI